MDVVLSRNIGHEVLRTEDEARVSCLRETSLVAGSQGGASLSPRRKGTPTITQCLVRCADKKYLVLGTECGAGGERPDRAVGSTQYEGLVGTRLPRPVPRVG